MRQSLTVLALLLASFPAPAQVRHQQPKPAEDGESAIEELLSAYATAISELTFSRDAKTVTRFYSPDYTEISDGKFRDLRGAREALDDVIDNVRLAGASSPGVVIRFADISTQVFGGRAVATFRFTRKAAASGRLYHDDVGMCTVLLRKAGVWLIEHEHCSTEKPGTPSAAAAGGAGVGSYSPPPPQLPPANVQPLIPFPVTVPAQRFAYFPFRVFGGRARVSGWLDGNDVQFVIVSDKEIANFTQNRPYRAYYNTLRFSGRRFVDLVLPPGHYAAFFDNRHASIIGKSVAGSLLIQY